MLAPSLPWVLLAVIVAVLLFLDLGVLHRRPHKIKTKEALQLTLLWITAALVFNAALYWAYTVQIPGFSAAPESPRDRAIEFLTAYLVEKSLSIDNIFVIAMVFRYCKIEDDYQHRVLYWGILGAFVMRATLIVFGLAVVHRFSFATYFLGGVLVITALRMLHAGDSPATIENSRIVRWTRGILPIDDTYQGDRFIVQTRHGAKATPLLLSLFIVELSDVVFAVDSIPAVLSISDDAYVAVSSNIFAVLGLRSLYFAVAALIGKFEKLQHSLSLVLLFIGAKMMLARQIHISPGVSLSVILLLLGGGIIVSMLPTDR